MSMTGFDHAVAWREFRTLASRPSGDEDAFIRAHKRVTYAYSGSGDSYSMTGVRGSIRVSRSESWVVRGHQTPHLLRHEQGHFDITAIALREEHDRTSTLTGSSAGDLSSQYQAIRAEINTKLAAVNKRYDTQTGHSTDEGAQRRWLAAIASTKRDAHGTLDDLPS